SRTITGSRRAPPSPYHNRERPLGGRLQAVRRRQAEAAGELFLTLVLGAFVLGIVVGMVRLGIQALGTPADRAAGTQALQQTDAPLSGRYRDRLEIPWYGRPAQYGLVEGELDGMTYHLLLMPWNAEDCGGAGMLSIAAGPGRPVSPDTGKVLFTPSETFH